MSTIRQGTFYHMDQPTDQAYCLSRHFTDHDESKDSNKTPRDSNDHWRFTPNILETNSFSFPSFGNQPGYYTPTPGGTSTAYHNQAGDLHTPGMGFNLGTPLSMPTSDVNIHSVAADIHGFNPHMFDSHHFHATHLYAPQQSFAPSTFVHQDAGFDAMEATTGESPAHDLKMEAGLRGESNLVAFTPRTFESSMPAPPLPAMEK